MDEKNTIIRDIKIFIFGFISSIKHKIFHFLNDLYFMLPSLGQ